jgi:hypothetical protein
MGANQTLFKFFGKPVTKWVARRAMIGRNRSRLEPEQGRFTTAEVNRILDQSWRDFDTLLPDLSRQPTLGSRLNLRLATLTLTFYRNLTAAGIESQYAIELISDTCWKIYQWWGYLGKLTIHLFHTDVIGLQSQRVQPDGTWRISFPFNPPGYLARYVPTENGLGFDMIRCPVAEYMRAQGASDLAVGTWCMLDYALAEMQGLRPERTGTLAGGDKQCNFRWFPADKQ